MSKKNKRIAGAVRKIPQPRNNKKEKKIRIDLEKTQLNLIDVEPEITKQKKLKDRVLDEIYLPDLI